jgi:predicted metal-dependent peptidase
MSAQDKIRSFYQSWFITEPILFAVVNTHKLTPNNKLKTLRVGKGLIEFNEEFINKQSEEDLKQLLIFEAFRILCKHPYERKRQNPIANLTGSNVTVQEYLATHLEMPQAREMFQNLLKTNRTKEQEKFAEMYGELEEMEDSELEGMTGMSKAKLRSIRDSIPDMTEEELRKRHFEFYYNLVDQNLPEMIESSPTFEGLKDAIDKALGEGPGGEGDGEEAEGQGQGDGSQEGGDMSDHFDPQNALEQHGNWGEDELQKNEINNAIQDAQVTNKWGSVPGSMQDMLTASLNPKVDYKSILKKFRASVLSSETVTNRMRPSRRYGFGFPGRRRDFTTRLAFFVDVSGSMTNDILQKGFGVINKFFKYGVKETDVYQFDTELKDEKPLKMFKAQKEIKLLGRGGTDFQCVVDHLAKVPEYDGVIIYTDGYSYRPTIPKGLKTKNILWLYDTETNYNECKENLKGIGRAAYIRSDREY